MFTRQSAAMCGRLLSRTAPLSSRAAGAAAFTTRASTPIARRFAAAPTPAGGRAQRLSQVRFASNTPENKDKGKESTSKPQQAKEQRESEPEPEEEEEEEPKKSRAPAVAFVIVGSLIFLISSYGSYQYVTYQRAVEASKHLDVPEDVSDRYDQNASTFDATVDWAEWASGINGHRRRLALMATGNVLEVSCGTGRNEPYYQYGEKLVAGPEGRPAALGVRTVTFLDQSAAMLEIARARFERKHGEWMARTRWLAQSAMEPVPLPTELFHFVLKEPGEGGSREVPPAKFDTVLQTMGLCSVKDPVAHLKRLGELVHEEGRVLLLEHGRGDRAWVNRILDGVAPLHADRHGCWWNRDIQKIVEESGLEVVNHKRWHFGTTSFYVLMQKREKKKEGEEKEATEKKE